MSARGPSPQGGVRTPSNSVGRGWERGAEGAGRNAHGRHALALALPPGPVFPGEQSWAGEEQLPSPGSGTAGAPGAPWLSPEGVSSEMYRDSLRGRGRWTLWRLPVPLPLEGPLAPESGPPRLLGPTPATESSVCALGAVSRERKGGQGGQEGRSSYFIHFPRIYLRLTSGEC